MKTCSKCKKKKEKSEFSINRNAPDGLQLNCKTCATKKACDWYREHRNDPDVIKRSRERDLKRVLECREIVNEKKRKDGCCYCLERDICCLDCHHLGDKVDLISTLVKKKNKDRLRKELEKCIIVCANCHRKIHAGRFDAHREHDIFLEWTI
jgi:hypothetical protein